LSELFDAARSGEKRAQEEIHRRIRAFARTILRGRTSAAGGVEWEDLAQEAASKFFTTGLSSYRGGGSENSYLYSIVKTTAISLARSTERRRARETTFVENFTYSACGAGSHFDIRSILLGLNDDCRALVLRVFLGGASYSELARESGLAESSVRAKLSRCLRKARELASKSGRP
jgi:RNA polymerase sigma factor (sigma-70 family)